MKSERIKRKQIIKEQIGVRETEGAQMVVHLSFLTMRIINEEFWMVLYALDRIKGLLMYIGWQRRRAGKNTLLVDIG